eukprot:5865228-Prymnesium_polylepis.1
MRLSAASAAATGTGEMPSAPATATKFRPPPIFFAVRAHTTLRPSPPAKAATSGWRSSATAHRTPANVPSVPTRNAGSSEPALRATARRSALSSSIGVARRTASDCASSTCVDAAGSTPPPAAANVSAIAQIGPESVRPTLLIPIR